jgi:hypothetical protein
MEQISKGEGIMGDGDYFDRPMGWNFNRVKEFVRRSADCADAMIAERKKRGIE